MREYGQIQSAFWQSEGVESMSDRGKLLACYLLTGPYTNGLGCFRVTDGNIMDDLGWASETVSETLSELYRIGFAYRLGKVAFLPNFLRWNGIANPNVAKARIKELETLPTNDAKALAARALLKFCGYLTADHETVLQTLSQTVSETVLQTLSKQNPTQPNPEPTQNQNQNQPRAKEREKTTGRKPATAAVEIDTWITSLAGQDAIPAADPIFDYADTTGIPLEFLALSWERFRDDMRERHKRQKDWRAHYRNAVRGNWYKLWWFDETGTCQLTTTGKQAERAAA